MKTTLKKMLLLGGRSVRCDTGPKATTNDLQMVTNEILLKVNRSFRVSADAHFRQVADAERACAGTLDAPHRNLPTGAFHHVN